MKSKTPLHQRQNKSYDFLGKESKRSKFSKFITGNEGGLENKTFYNGAKLPPKPVKINRLTEADQKKNLKEVE